MSDTSLFDKHFTPQDIEAFWSAQWEARGYAQATLNPEHAFFSMLLPPPNTTGTLHMGHGFNQTIMDSYARYHRMRGANTLWIPGTDHAGIATQMVVERQLDAQNISRHSLGRAAFIERVWEWKNRSGSTITQQIRRLGASIDWSREYFTMDSARSQAVCEAFVRLYEDGLIYRGRRLVNWDPHLKTAVSDLEVISEEEEGYLWHIRYPLSNGAGSITVATTRPETLPGDAAVMVHPDDARYQAWIGQTVRLPLCDREIPIIADEAVDPTFGTGAVKVTPAHDFNDYQVGGRHGLPMLEILTLDAKLNDAVPSAYQGMDRFDARKALCADLESAGFLERVVPHKLMVPRGDRSGAVIEPMLTDQWFLAMNKVPANQQGKGAGTALRVSLVQTAREAVESEQVKLVPDNWSNTYRQWLNHIEDWCISRQLWWGHQIPAWHSEAGHIYVARSEEEAKQQALAAGDTSALAQDPDVLDTWFSSALLPFSALGWPNKTPELEYFLPTSLLVTGFDILFFWVMRMVMLTRYFTGQIPFQTVYVHGLVRDAEGQKMSKSKGNTLDPLDLIDGITLEALVAKRTTGLMNPKQASSIEKKTRQQFPQGIPAFGSDALRLTFTSLATLGRTISFDLARCEGYRHFCNKLWNAARFVTMNCVESLQPIAQGDASAVTGVESAEQIPSVSAERRQDMGIADRWIRARLQMLIADVDQGFATYRLDLVSQALYQFIWEEYCDWYLEFAKVQLQNSTPKQQYLTRRTLLQVLEAVLRLAHPIMPFITEALWQKIAPLAQSYTALSAKGEPATGAAPLPEEAAHTAEGQGDATRSIMMQAYPQVQAQYEDDSAQEWVTQLKKVVETCRGLRADMQLSPAQRVPLFATGAALFLKESTPYLKALARLSDVHILEDEASLDAAVHPAPTRVLGLQFNTQFVSLKIALKVEVNTEEEAERLSKELARLEQEMVKCQAKLANPAFVSKAPANVVEQEKTRCAQYETLYKKLTEQRARLLA